MPQMSDKYVWKIMEIPFVKKTISDLIERIHDELGVVVTCQLMIDIGKSVAGAQDDDMVEIVNSLLK